MEFMPKITNDKEVEQLGRKGAVALAIFKTVTIVVLLYSAVALWRGQDPGAFATAYLTFAGAVLTVFAGTNVGEHFAKKGA